MSAKEYIFALDADEYIEPDELSKFSELISKYDLEAVWFLFKNEITSNGITVNLQKLMGDDPHPRFWKKALFINGQPRPTLQWPHEAHKFPEIATEKQAFLNTFITHQRELDSVIKTHLLRGQVIDPKAQQMEKEFIAGVLKEFGKEVVENVKLKFPELDTYLKGTTNGK